MSKHIAVAATAFVAILVAAMPTQAQSRRHPYDRTYNGHRPAEYPWFDQGVANLRGLVDNITWGGNEAIARNRWDQRRDWDDYDRPVFWSGRRGDRNMRFAREVIPAIGSEIRATIRHNALMTEMRADRYRPSSRDRLDAIDEAYGTRRDDRQEAGGGEIAKVFNLTPCDATIEGNKVPSRGHAFVEITSSDRSIDVRVDSTTCNEKPVKLGTGIYAIVCRD